VAADRSADPQTLAVPLPTSVHWKSVFSLSAHPLGGVAPPALVLVGAGAAAGVPEVPPLDGALLLAPPELPLLIAPAPEAVSSPAPAAHARADTPNETAPAAAQKAFDFIPSLQ
jgi:hypothetical protein